MRARYRTYGWLWALALPVAVASCGDDDGDGADNGADGDGADDGDGGGDGVPGGERYEGCTQVIEAGSDTEAIQTALIEAKTNSVLCFADGTYELDNELSLTVNKVTLRGNPKDRDKVVLDYAKQTEGKDALSVSSSDFTIEHMTIKNSRGNSIVVKGAERPTFRNLNVYWDAGPRTENGAYAVYPLSCTDVLVEDCEVNGASDAGIYVGQSQRVIVRNNKVHGNVAGVEIENTDTALVTGNEMFDNTAGLLVFVMPNLEKKDGSATIVENNVIHNNNRPNFGEAGTTVSFVPSGLGVLLLANDGTEVRDNEIRDNGTTGVLAISFSTYSDICEQSGGDNCSPDDGGTDPDASETYIHDNTFADNGTQLDEGVALLFLGVDPVENVIWDGKKPEGGEDEDHFCLGDDPPSVRVIGDQEGIRVMRNNDITDGAMFSCTLPSPFDSLELPQDQQ